MGDVPNGTTSRSIYASRVPDVIHSELPLLLAIGLILLAITGIRNKVLSAMSGYLLIIGTIVFAVANLIGPWQASVEAVGAVFTAVEFIWVGFPFTMRRSIKVR